MEIVGKLVSKVIFNLGTKVEGGREYGEFRGMAYGLWEFLVEKRAF